MPAYRNINGTWRSALCWRNIGGVWKSCRAWRNIAGVWKLVSGQLSAFISPSPVYANSISNPVTASAQCYPVDGVGPYNYAWLRMGGDAITLTAPSSALTGFSSGALSIGQSRSAPFQCTVTDTATGLIATATVDVTLERS